MGFPFRLLLVLALAAPLPGAAQTLHTFRQWIAGQEAGGATERVAADPQGARVDSHEWSQLERMGAVLRQDLKQTALRRPDGGMTFTWTLTLSQEPMTGTADWSPKEPARLRLRFQDGSTRTLDVPTGTVLWPEDEETALKAAARTRQPVRLHGFSFPTQQWTRTDLDPVGPDPLPGFPDTVHYRGRAMEGQLVEEVDLWISPTEGQVKHQGAMAGIPLLTQRAELPPPAGPQPAAGLFERTLKVLPPHPFLLWLPEVRVRWTGASPQDLPEDAQQHRLGPDRFRLTRALPPTPAEAAEPPVKGPAPAGEARYLAPTPLVQFRDPVFEGLLRRMAPRPGASRWELARRVTDFVYDWIRDKNYAVGFASAREVARNPQGACAQHGVLAVALLRRLGVPARGATGWIAYGQVLGLHFWVEVEVGGRWIPVDPTFDQAPASAYRLRLGSSDLADLSSVGWGAATLDFLEGAWVPDGPWGTDVRIQGDRVTAPDGTVLRLAGAAWRLHGGNLTLAWAGTRSVEAVPRPAPAQMAGAHHLQGPASRRQGWWQPASRLLWIDLGEGRWLQVDGLDEARAFQMLDALEVSRPTLAQAA